MLAQPPLLAPLGAACFSGHSIVPQHPHAISASVRVGSIVNAGEQRQAAVSPWWFVEGFISLTKSRWNFEFAPSVLSRSLHGVN